MQVADHDLLDRFTVVVDPDAQPVDWDGAILDFLQKVITKRRSAGTPAADSSVLAFPETKGYCNDLYV